MKNWSINDLHQFTNLTDVKFSIKGTGTVSSQSIAAGTKVDKKGTTITIYYYED